MTFNSVQYAVFFVFVLLVYWRLPRRGQNVLLLIASYVFYAAFDYRFLSLLLLSTGLDYWFGISLDRTNNDRARKWWLFASLAVNLGILGFFKYFDFFIDSMGGLLRRLGFEAHPPLLRILLPVGISFYTFHGISYVFDIYRRGIRPTTSPLDYAVFVAFFPQLVAGPIGRAHLQLPQFGRDRTPPTRTQTADALTLILFGLFKKVVIADAVAGPVTTAFGNAESASALTLVVAAWGFALQIYGDFCGYTDIARGSARLLGIELPVNFRQPYMARSITEFWRRWHISLSNWLRDYVYIPFGGNRGSRFQTDRNLIATMLLGGLWHGASWTFVVWGGFHGVLLALDRALGRDRFDPERPLTWRDAIPVFTTANIAAALFIIFRAESFANAVDYFSGLLSLRGGPVPLNDALLVVTAGIAIFVIDLIQRRSDRDISFSGIRRPELVGAIVGAMIVLIAISSGGIPVPFIYFRF